NIGSSPAFDVRVSDIEGPFLQQVQYRERLTTDLVCRLLLEKKTLVATHHRRVPGNDLDHQAAFTFLRNAGQALPPTDGHGNPLDNRLRFFLEYSALDGAREFRTECLIHFNLGFPNPRAQIVPASSWLG